MMNTILNNHGSVVGDSSAFSSLLNAMAQNPNDLMAKLGLSFDANNVDNKNGSALRDVALQAFMSTLASFASARVPTCNSNNNTTLLTSNHNHSNTTCDPALSLFANDDVTAASSSNNSALSSSAPSFPFQTPNATNFMLNDFDTHLAPNANEDLMLSMMNDRWSTSISTSSSASSSTYSPDSVHPQATPSTSTQLDDDVVVVVDEPSEPSSMSASSLPRSTSIFNYNNGGAVTSNGQLTFATLPSLSNTTHLSHSTQVPLQHQLHPQFLPASFVASSSSLAAAVTTLPAAATTAGTATIPVAAPAPATAAPLLDDDFIVEIVTPSASSSSSSSSSSSVPVVKSETASTHHVAATKRKRRSVTRRTKANNATSNNTSVSTPTSSPSPDAEPCSSSSGVASPSTIVSIGASASAPSLPNAPPLPISSLMQQQQLQQHLLSAMMAATQSRASNPANNGKVPSRCVSADSLDSLVTDATSLSTTSASSVHALSVFSSFDNMFSVASNQPHQPQQSVSSPSSSSSSRRHSDNDEEDDGDVDDDEVDEEEEDAIDDDESDSRSVSTTASRFSFKSRRGSAIDVSNSSSSTPSTRENKKRLRLARKAELARVSRAKKKQRLDELELHVNALQSELERLKREERVAVAAATVAARKQRHEKVQQAATMASGGEVEEDAVVGRVLARVDPSLSGQRIEEAVEHLASAAHASTMSSDVLSHLMATLNERHQQHLEVGDDLLQRLQQHLKPILPLEFLQWIMSQPTRFYDAADNTNGSNGGGASSLWWSLFRDELQCDGAQMKELSALRTTVAKQLKCVNECERAWRRFSEVCRQGVWATEMEQMVQLQRVMDPTQFARFCAWVTRYGHLCLNFQQHINVNSTITNNSVPTA